MTVQTQHQGEAIKWTDEQLATLARYGLTQDSSEEEILAVALQQDQKIRELMAEKPITATGTRARH